MTLICKKLFIKTLSKIKVFSSASEHLKNKTKIGRKEFVKLGKEFLFFNLNLLLNLEKIRCNYSVFQTIFKIVKIMLCWIISNLCNSSPYLHKI